MGESSQRLSRTLSRLSPAEILEAVLWMMGIGAALVFFVVKIHSWGPFETFDAPEQSDFTSYYLGARISLIRPEALYQHDQWPAILDAQPQGADNLRAPWPYRYIPTFAWALRPLGMLPYRIARRVWFWGGILALVITAAGFLYMKQRGIPAVGGLLLWILLPATLDNLYLGQIGIFLAPLVLFGIAGLCTESRRLQFAGGGLIGLAGSVKLFPLSLVVVAPWRKKWFYGIGCIAGLILVVVVGFAVLPLSTWAGFGHVLQTVTLSSPEEPILNNQSLFVFWHKFAIKAALPLVLRGRQVGLLMSHPSMSPALAVALACGSVLLVIVFTGIALRKFYRYGHAVFAWTLVLISALIAAPLTWWHYATIAAPMFPGIVKMRACLSLKWRLLLPLGYLLIVCERAKTLYLQIFPHPALSSMMLFGMLLWWLVFVCYALRLGKEDGVA